MNIPKRDLKIETMRGTGPGGQHRNRGDNNGKTEIIVGARRQRYPMPGPHKIGGKVRVQKDTSAEASSCRCGCVEGRRIGATIGRAYIVQRIEPRTRQATRHDIRRVPSTLRVVRRIVRRASTCDIMLEADGGRTGRDQSHRPYLVDRLRQHDAAVSSRRNQPVLRRKSAG